MEGGDPRGLWVTGDYDDHGNGTALCVATYVLGVNATARGVSVSPSSWCFSRSGDSRRVLVGVARDYADTTLRGPESFTLGLSGVDQATEVTVTVMNVDEAAAVLSTLSVSVSAGGASASYGVRLASAPAGVVEVRVISDDPSRVSVGSGVVIFNASNWNTSQAVSVSGQHPSGLSTVAFASVPLRHSVVSSADAAYSGAAVLPDAALEARWSQAPGPLVVLSRSDVLVFEGGSPGSYTVVLEEAPATGLAAVRVSISVSATISFFPLQTDWSNVVVSPAVVVFGASNWSVPRTVQVSYPDDFVANSMPTTGLQDLTHAVSVDWSAGHSGAADGGYELWPSAVVTASLLNKDTAAVRVSGTVGLVAEAGGAFTFNVTLTSKPHADVALALTNPRPDLLNLTSAAAGASVGVDGTLRWTVTPATFTSNTSVVVRAVVSSVDDLLTGLFDSLLALTLSATSADADYDSHARARISPLFEPSGTVLVARIPNPYENCPSGAYRAGVQCLTCPAGYACAEPSAAPVLCGPGFFAAAGSTQCSSCAAGTYSPASGAVTSATCNITGSGYYSLAGSPWPAPCPAGYWCPAQTGDYRQFPCPAGTYSSATGLKDASQCVTCDAGAYCRAASVTPTKCSAGTYNPVTGSDDATDCRPVSAACAGLLFVCLLAGCMLC